MKYKFDEQFLKNMHEFDRNYQRKRYQTNEKFHKNIKKYCCAKCSYAANSTRNKKKTDKKEE